MVSCKVIFIVFGLLSVLSVAKIDYFWHITDTHVQSDYKVGSNTKKGCYEGTGNAGKFGDYGCRPPYIVEWSGMAEMPTRIPDECPNTDPLFVLWTGDSVAKRDGRYSKEAIEYNFKNITEAFTKLHSLYQGKVPIYPIIGNHDAYPQHQLPGHEYWVYSELADLWEPFIGKDAADSFKKSGYYTVNVNKKLRLIALNTVLYYTPNNMTSTSDKDPGGQIAWLEKTLKAAKNADEVVFIAGHIPIRGSSGSFRKEYVDYFLNAMKNYQSIIKGSFWGHHHVDTFQLVGDSTTNAHVGHLGGSISTQNDRNPTIRRYLLDTSKDYKLLSWRTFYMDLPEVNKAGKPKWGTLFDSKKDYGLEDLTPSSIVSFMKKLENDDKLFETVWKHRYGGGPISECKGSCKKDFICSVLHTDHKEYEKCIKK